MTPRVYWHKGMIYDQPGCFYVKDDQDCLLVNQPDYALYAIMANIIADTSVGVIDQTSAALVWLSRYPDLPTATEVECKPWRRQAYQLACQLTTNVQSTNRPVVPCLSSDEKKSSTGFFGRLAMAFEHLKR